MDGWMDGWMVLVCCVKRGFAQSFYFLCLHGIKGIVRVAHSNTIHLTIHPSNA